MYFNGPFGDLDARRTSGAPPSSPSTATRRRRRSTGGPSTSPTPRRWPSPPGIPVAPSGPTTFNAATDIIGTNFVQPNTGQQGYWLLNVASAGTYDLKLTTNASGGTAPGQVEVFLNDKQVGGIINVSASSTIDLGNLPLPAGLNTISIYVVHGANDPSQSLSTYYLSGRRPSRLGTGRHLRAGRRRVRVGRRLGSYGVYAYDPAGSAWTFAGNAGRGGQHSGFTSGNPAAPQGSQVAFLQGTGPITQAVAGWAAGTYTLSFYAAQRGNSCASPRTSRCWSTARRRHLQAHGNRLPGLHDAAFTVGAGIAHHHVPGARHRRRRQHRLHRRRLRRRSRRHARRRRRADSATPGSRRSPRPRAATPTTPAAPPGPSPATPAWPATTRRFTSGNPAAPAGVAGRLPPGHRARSPSRSPAGPPAPTPSPSTRPSAATTAAGRGLPGPGRRHRRRHLQAHRHRVPGLHDGRLRRHGRVAHHRLPRASTPPAATTPPSSTPSPSPSPSPPPPPPPTAPTVGDAGFESVAVGLRRLRLRPHRLGLGLQPATLGVAGNNSAFTSGNPVAPQGTQVGFLQSRARSPSRSPAGPPAPTPHLRRGPERLASAARRTSRCSSTACRRDLQPPGHAYQAFHDGLLHRRRGPHT